MDRYPSDHGHDELEESVGSCDQVSAGILHIGFNDAVRYGYREGIHRKSHTEKYAVYKKENIIVHLRRSLIIIKVACSLTLLFYHERSKCGSST